MKTEDDLQEEYLKMIREQLIRKQTYRQIIKDHWKLMWLWIIAYLRKEWKR